MQSAVVSDLVRDSKLDATFHGEITRHVIEIAGHNARQRKIKQHQLWQRTESLGEGAYGTVWLEKLVEGKCTVSERAVKVIKKQVHKNVDYSRELEAIAKFSHPKYNSCFVESYGWFESERDVYIAMEYFPLGDLQGYLSAPLPESEVQQICFQTLEGLEYMHSNGFAHRDLKPSNLLVRSPSPDWWIKIGDFGISKRAEEGHTALRTFSGTVGFLAPEILVQNGLLDCEEFGQLRDYTVAVDIWSLGEIVFRALTTQSPFMKGLASYIRGTTQFPEEILRKHHVSPAGCHLVRNLLKPMPSERPTAGAALLHRWIAPQEKSSPKSSMEFSRQDAQVNAEKLFLINENRSLTGQTRMSKRVPVIGDRAIQQTQASMASAAWSTIKADETHGEAKSSSPIERADESTEKLRSSRLETESSSPIIKKVDEPMGKLGFSRLEAESAPPIEKVDDFIGEFWFSRLATTKYEFGIEGFDRAFRLPDNHKVVVMTNMRIMLISSDALTVRWEISWMHVESITNKETKGVELKSKMPSGMPRLYCLIPVRHPAPRRSIYETVCDSKIAYDEIYPATKTAEKIAEKTAEKTAEEKAAELIAKDKRAAEEMDKNKRRLEIEKREAEEIDRYKLRSEIEKREAEEMDRYILQTHRATPRAAGKSATRILFVELLRKVIRKEQST
ncbi:kinase-like domain-containing protein [Paraphoma chrysanthemicola]|uniref:Autophagy-related protein 1 n=1 Tax=Paraphoma chrysanthemicola TaxID=798071 RepID=A0A8K0QY99_9PLEO|nr:kinase-like domain-containing protein [Paraphoma chrysanthemicola]